jgi:hypothetical protein
MRLAPLKCSIPHCHNTVGYHRSGQKGNKQCCEYHRKKGKKEVDDWKLQQGCANKDGHYGFACVCSQITHPATLDINHIDGNNLNRNKENIEVLCKMCHTVVTIQHKHHIPTGPRKWKISPMFDEFFQEEVSPEPPEINKLKKGLAQNMLHF